MKTIKGKILASSLSMLAVAFLTVSVIVVFNLNNLVDSFLELSELRSDEVATDMKDWSENTKNKISDIFEESLRTKGNTLLVQDSLVVRPAFVDNALTDVKNFLTKKFSLDDEIVHASFFTAEEGSIKAWHYVNTHYPEGLGFIAKYDQGTKTWTSKTDNKEIKVVDDRILGIIEKNDKALEIIDYEVVGADGKSKVIRAYEAIIPVIDGDLGEVVEFREDGETIGYLRYILSLEKMQLAISNEEAAVSEALLLQQEKGQAADKKTREIGSTSLTRSVAIVGVSALCILFFALGVSAKIAGRIARPVGELTESAAVIASGNYEKPIHVKSTDEVGILGKTFDDMRLKVKKFTENLQEMIDEKTEDISSMLTNIEQGIFTITKDFTIHPEYSAFLEKIFGTNEIANRPFEEFIFGDTSLTSEQVSCACSVVVASLGNSKVAFKVNSKHLPREFHIERNGEKKYLEFDWCPILKNKKIEKIMVTVRDVTELKKLQVASAQKALELSMIEQLMQIEAPKFHEVYDQSMSLLNECKKLCAKPDSNDDDITIIFRDLHTAKGVLRTYGLKITSALIHDTEEAFIEVKNSGAKHIPDDQQAEMLHKIGESIASLESYKIVNDEKLGRSQNNSNLDKKSLSEVKRVINLFFSDAVEAEKLFGKVESILNKTYKNSIKEHIRDLVDRVSTSAQSLGKEALRFAYEGENITLKTEDWNILDGIFTHMIRNSLDHGVELPEERQQANKESSGLISMEAATDSQWLHIKFYDDGRGLNLNKLRSKGGLDENASDAEVANLIFKPSMSTADNVTDISGRGVGMDAVKASIQEFGGSIDLELGQRQGDFIPAKISLKLPLSRLELEKIDQKAS